MKTYLVALDTSAVASDVLAAAGELAQKMDARLVLLHAVPLPTELPPEAYTISPEKVAPLLLQAAREELLARQRELPQGVTVESVITLGSPWRVICDEAKARQVDLIVLGAHGHRFLDRILGTTTQQVVAHAERSVLIVWKTTRS